jgi:hypothetical protein
MNVNYVKLSIKTPSNWPYTTVPKLQIESLCNFFFVLFFVFEFNLILLFILVVSFAIKFIIALLIWPLTNDGIRNLYHQNKRRKLFKSLFILKNFHCFFLVIVIIKSLN